MLIGAYKKFCKDYDKVEGYERALSSDEPYFIHHKQGIYISQEELIELGWYYDCPPDCLMWVTKSEHSAIHNAHIRYETRKKLSEASKGERNPMYGKTCSDEARQKMRGPRGECFKNNESWMNSHTGENNVSKRQDVRNKISEKAKNRYKITRDDGTWYWGHR